MIRKSFTIFILSILILQAMGSSVQTRGKNANIQELQEQQEKMERDLYEVEKTNDDQEQKIKRNKNKIVSTSDELLNVEGRISSLENDRVEKLEMSVRQISELLNQTTHLVITLSAQNDETMKKSEEMENQISLLQTQLNNTEVESQNMKTKIQNLEAENENVRSELNEVKRDLKNLNATVDDCACSGLNECELNIDKCDSNAVCSDTKSGYECACASGFIGDGFTCQDLDECLLDNGGCHDDAKCINQLGGATCACGDGFTGTYPNCTEPKENCFDIYQSDSSLSDGVYTIYPLGDASSPVQVWCDMQNGGYTVLQHRRDGSVDFAQPWVEYVGGFGSSSGEYWLGLENIHALTTRNEVELHIDLMDWDGVNKFAHYGSFNVSQGEEYRIHFGEYSGTAGNSFDDSRDYHQNMAFSTYDKDQDLSPNNCASRYGSGGWWFNSCFRCSLNGGNYHSESASGIYWVDFHNSYDSLKSSTMKIINKS